MSVHDNPPTDSEIEDAIRVSISSGVESVSVDGLSATEMDLKDRLDALERLEHRTSSDKSHRGLRFTVLRSPASMQ